MAQISYSPVPDQTASGEASPMQHLDVPGEAVGAGLAESAGKASERLQQINQQQFATALKFQDMANETAANKSATAYADFVSKQETDFRAKEGVNATAAFPGFQKSLQDGLVQYGQGLSPAAQLAYQRDARSFYQRSMYSAGIHVGDQAKKANDDAQAASIETSISLAVNHPNDPAAFETSLQDVRDKAIVAASDKGMEKPAAEAYVQAHVGQLVGRTIKAMLDNNDIDGATALWNRMQQEKDPHSGLPAVDAKDADAIGALLKTTGKQIYGQQDKAATDAAASRLAQSVGQGKSSIGDAITSLADIVNSGSDKLQITDPNQRAMRISDATSKWAIGLIQSMGATGTGLAADKRSLAAQQDAYDKLSQMKLPGFEDQPLLNQAAQDSIAIRLHTEAETIERRSDAENEKYAAQLRVPLIRSITNGAAMVDQGLPASGLPTNAQIYAAYPKNPAEAADKIEMVDELRRVSGFLTGFPNMNLDQMERVRLTVAPSASRPGTFAQDTRISRAIDTAINRTVTALKNDPAQYMLTAHPDSASLQQQFTTAMQDPGAQASHIPLASAGQTAFGAYVDKMDSLQANMGIPSSARHVLPVATATSIANGIAADPQSAGQKMQQLQQQFGDRWATVWHDVTTLGKLPADYQLIGALDNKQDSELLARAMVEGKAGKNIDDLLPPKMAADIKTNVLNNAQLNNYLFSLDASGASDEQKMGIRDAVLKLAYAKAFYNRDPAAAGNAIKDVVGRYEFLPGGGRVPTAQSSAIKSSARSFLNGLDVSKITVPDVFGQPGMPDARDYIDGLKAAPHWITSPKGDSLWLKDSGNRIVTDKQGHPVSVPFSGIAVAPRAPIRPTASAFPSGMVEPGTENPFDYSKYPKVKNSDGSVSNVVTFSANVDGKEVLLPSMIGGKKVSQQEAIAHYKKTGEHFGKFDTPANAAAFAKSVEGRMNSAGQ